MSKPDILHFSGPVRIEPNGHIVVNGVDVVRVFARYAGVWTPLEDQGNATWHLGRWQITLERLEDTEE